MFEVVQQAAITLAGGDGYDYSNISHPSTLKNIGYDIKHLAEITEEMAIMENNTDKINESKLFIKLYIRKWKLLAASSQKQLEERSYNKILQLPSCEDLMKITKVIKKELSKINTKGTIDSQEYTDVAESVQARLVLFNKRRPGELEALM